MEVGEREGNKLLGCGSREYFALLRSQSQPKSRKENSKLRQKQHGRHGQDTNECLWIAHAVPASERLQSVALMSVVVATPLASSRIHASPSTSNTWKIQVAWDTCAFLLTTLSNELLLSAEAVCLHPRSQRLNAVESMPSAMKDLHGSECQARSAGDRMRGCAERQSLSCEHTAKEMAREACWRKPSPSWLHLEARQYHMSWNVRKKLFWRMTSSKRKNEKALRTFRFILKLVQCKAREVILFF